MKRFQQHRDAINCQQERRQREYDHLTTEESHRQPSHDQQLSALQQAPVVEAHLRPASAENGIVNGLAKGEIAGRESNLAENFQGRAATLVHAQMTNTLDAPMGSATSRRTSRRGGSSPVCLSQVEGFVEVDEADLVDAERGSCRHGKAL